MSKRLSSVRRGIQYQDLVAAEFLLDMVFHDGEVPLWVKLENRVGGSFDDVVVGYPDRVVWKQIKWAANPGAEPLTVTGLAAVDPRRKKPLIVSFSESYRAITQQGKYFQLDFITNRAFDSEFQRLLSGTQSTIKARLSKTQINILNSQWLPLTGFHEKEFAQFLRTLHFLVNMPDISIRQQYLQRMLLRSGCGEIGYQRLMEAIGNWSVDDTKEEIVRDDVEAVLGTPLSDIPSNTFQLTEKRVERTEAHQELMRRVNSLENGYLVVLGAPGSGKSTILNTLKTGNCLPANTDIVVYNCFTGTSDSFLRTRARADNFARFLARELYGLYTFQIGRLIDVEPGDIETYLVKASNCCQQEDRRLVLVIDGIDYAKRFSQSNTVGLYDSLPINLPSRIIAIVSAQVVEQLPAHMQHITDSQLLTVPPLDNQQIHELLRQYHIIGEGKLQPYEEDELCREVATKTGGHALQASYVANQLADGVVRGIEWAATLSEIDPFDGDMENYYNTLLARPNAALARKALALMACSPFELTIDEIAGMLSPSVDPHIVEDSLEPYLFLLQRTGRFLHFCHDSLRAFALQHLPADCFPAKSQVEFLLKLPNDSRIGEHLLHLVAEEESVGQVLDNINCNWISKQIAAGANLSLIGEGLRELALSAVQCEDWKSVSRWWGLLGCLEWAGFPGELDEANLVDAWLAMKELDLVERYIYIGGQFLGRSYPGPDIIDLLHTYECNALAARLEERLVTQTAPRVHWDALDFEYEDYIQHLALRAPPSEVVATIRKSLKEAEEAEESHLNSFHPQFKPLAHYADIAAYACLNAEQYDRVEEWLRQEPLCMKHETAWDIWLRTRIACKDVTNHREKVELALEVIEDRKLLVELLAFEGFEDAVRKSLNTFNLASSDSKGYPWYEYNHAYSLISNLFADAWLCSRLGLQERMRQTELSISCQPVRVAAAFQRAIVAIAKDTSRSPCGWRKGMDALIEEIKGLARHKLSIDDIQSAQFFVYNLGYILEPVAKAAISSGTMADFEKAVETQLLPALMEAHIHYVNGLLSICDMILTLEILPELVSRLLIKVEKYYIESCNHKASALMHLAGRYARIQDMESARRVLTAGIRAAFTYGYHKDTIINDYIVALEIIGSHLNDVQVFDVVEFLTQAFVILDELTDGEMIYDSPAHFLVVIWKLNKKLAVRVGKVLAKECKYRLRVAPVSRIFKEHGINGKESRQFLRQASIAYDKECAEDKTGEGFVSSDCVLETDIPLLKSDLAQRISSSSYATYFHTCPAFIRALVEGGRTPAAIAVFTQLTNSFKELFGCYPLADFGLDEN